MLVAITTSHVRHNTLWETSPTSVDIISVQTLVGTVDPAQGDLGDRVTGRSINKLIPEWNNRSLR